MLTFALVAAMSSAPTPTTEPHVAQLDALFAETKQPADNSPPPGVLWKWRLTPPFPVAWPLTASTPLRQYAFGAGMDLMLRDGERIAKPWATVDAVGAKKTVKRVADALAPLGTQGVRPLKAEEVKALQTLDGAAATLRKGDLAAVKDGYCLWLRVNGVVGAVVAKEHAAFVTALGCAGR